MIKSFKKLLTSVDVLNTINGGISEPFLSLQEQDSAREITVRVPGLTSESLQTEIVNNTLTIFYMIPININGQLMLVPQIIYNKTIPYFINTAKIDFLQRDHELVVRLPFNELRDGSTHRMELDHD